MKNSAILNRYTFSLKAVFLALILFPFVGFSQATTTVNYSPSSATIANPERGFYKHTEVHSANYSGLAQSTLNGYRGNNITLLLRVFHMENFVNAPISQAYLSAMQADFDKIRTAGLKCIVRFAYSDNTNGALDAPKARVLEHIAQVKTLLASNSDVIISMQAGFIGSWGEWYYTTQAEFGIPPAAPNYVNRGKVLKKWLSVLPTSRAVAVVPLALVPHDN